MTDSLRPINNMAEDESLQPKVVQTGSVSAGSEAKETPEYTRRLQKVPLVGHFFILGACINMTASATLIKILTTVNPLFIAGFRNIIIVFLSGCVLSAKGTGPLGIAPKKHRLHLIMRAVGGSCGLMLMYYSFRHLPLGDARMISATAPIFVSFLALKFLHEPCGLFDIVITVAALMGVVIVMQPPFLFGSATEAEELEERVGSYAHFFAGAIALLGALFIAVGTVVTRILKDVDVFVISLWNSAVGILPPFVVTYLMTGFESELPTTEYEFGVLVAVGIFSFFGQTMMTAALKFEKAGVASLVRKAEDILVAYFVQIIFFADVPNFISTIGAVIVSVCVVMSGARNLVEKSAKPDSLWRKLFCTAKKPEDPAIVVQQAVDVEVVPLNK